MQFYEINVSRQPHVVLINKNTLIPPQLHLSRVAKEYILYYIIEGSMLLCDGGNTVELSAGDVYMFYRGDYHEAVESRYCRYYYIHFYPEITPFCSDEQEVIGRLWDCRSYYLCSSPFDGGCYKEGNVILPKKLHIGNGTTAKRIRSLIRDAVLCPEGENKDFYKTVSALRIQEFFITLYRYYSEQKMNEASAFGAAAVGRLVVFLQENLTEHITGAMLEEKLGYCFDHMNRKFKAATGKTIFNYLTKMRINRAVQLMKTNTVTSAEVAQECGFSDVYYFSRVFKKNKGMTPNQYLADIDRSVEL